MVIVFVAVAVVHALWDFLPQLVDGMYADTPNTAMLIGYVIYAVFGVAGAVVWNVVRRRANRAGMGVPAVAEL